MSVNQAAEQLLAIVQKRRLQGEEPGTYNAVVIHKHSRLPTFQIPSWIVSLYNAAQCLFIWTLLDQQQN